MVPVVLPTALVYFRAGAAPTSGLTRLHKRRCHAGATPVPRRCHAGATSVPRRCHAGARLQKRHCTGLIHATILSYLPDAGVYVEFLFCVCLYQLQGDQDASLQV